MVTFSICETAKRKKDINKAIDIYLSAIDIETSYTNTNQIKEHILSTSNSSNRLLFFYNLYVNDEMFGFAEYGYLPNTQTLVIDYICTKERNHCAFYTFYQLTIDDITKKLSKKNLYFKYIITEISLAQKNGLYCDIDSNYFRKMLSMDNFVLLKYPYYQPDLEHKPFSFSIAIKSVSESSLSSPLNSDAYIEIIEDLYINHYGEWYEKYLDREKVYTDLNKLLSKIKKEIAPQKDSNKIALVSCPVFEAGKCQNVNIEPLTVLKKIKRNIALVLLFCFWLIISTLSFILVSFADNQISSIVSTIISVISGVITIFLYIRDFFRN